VQSIFVWDLPTRIFHWGLAASVGLAIAVEPEAGSNFTVHGTAGYVALLFVIFRLSWGFLGSPHSRFADFLYPPAKVADFALQHLRLKIARHVGHNPLGGWMIILVLAIVAATSITGLLGGPWRDLHGALGNLVILLVVLHLFGVVVDTLLTRDNIVLAMITGRKMLDDTLAAREPPLVGTWRAVVLGLLIAAAGGYVYGKIDWPALRSEQGMQSEEGD
jgi:cytochrome b